MLGHLYPISQSPMASLIGSTGTKWTWRKSSTWWKFSEIAIANNTVPPILIISMMQDNVPNWTGERLVTVNRYDP